MELKNVTVYKNPESYCIDPSICSLGGNNLIVGFREAVRREVPTDEALHIDPTSKGVIVRSRDGGKTWGDRLVVYPMPGAQSVEISKLSDGSLIASMFRWRVVPKERGEELKEFKRTREVSRYGWLAANEGIYITKSYLKGYDWLKPWRIDTSKVCDSAGLNHSPLELPNGDLLLACYGARIGGSEVSFALRSKDKGETWEYLSTIAQDPEGDVQYEEPYMLYLPKSKKLICLMRTAGAGGHIYQSDSYDNGETWSQPRDTGVWGHPPHLLLLKSGNMLCVYGYRRPPYGIRACFSRDEGETWDVKNERVLRDDGLGMDLGYPTSIQLDDGTIFSVYWIFGDDGIRHIAGTFFQE